VPISKPNSYLEWVPDTASNNLAEPPVSIRAVGFQAGQPVPAPYFNYTLHSLDRWVQYLSENVNATVLATSLNHSMRLMGGGTFHFDAQTRALSWSSTLTLAIPSSADTVNQLPQGAVMLPSGSVAYANVNLPFSTTADVTAQSDTVLNLGYEAGISPGMTVTGPGIADNTTVTDLEDTTCTLSQPATASGSQVTLTFVGTGPLTVNVAPSATLVPGPNTVVLARATANACSVGIGSTEMWLRDQESRTLVAAGYVTTVTAPAGEDLGAFKAVYQSQGTADGRTQGRLYLADASAANGAQRGLCLGFVHTATASGAEAHVVRTGILDGFSGLITGSAYYLDPATPGAISTAKPMGPGQTVAPVGVAISSTALALAIGAASTVATVKTYIYMGATWNPSTGLQPGPAYYGEQGSVIIQGVYGGSVGSMPRYWTAPSSGSIIGLNGTVSVSSLPTTVNFYVFKNIGNSSDPSYAGRIAMSSNKEFAADVYSSFGQSFAKGTYAFAAGDVLTLYVRSSRGGVEIKSNIDLIVDLNS